MVSTIVQDGSSQGIKGLSKLANKKGDRVIARIVKKGSASRPAISKSSIPKGRRLKSRKQRVKSRVGKKRRQRKVSYQIQNLIDSA